MASTEGAPLVEATIRRANFAKTVGFDLIEDTGWAFLAKEIAADFPYLTLAELNAIIKQGCKGELDKYKSLPLNVPRVYQWVKSMAPKQASTWKYRYPALMDYVERLCLTDIVTITLSGHTAAVTNESVTRAIVGQCLEGKYPRGKPERNVTVARIYQEWATEYPDCARLWGAQLA